MSFLRRRQPPEPSPESSPEALAADTRRHQEALAKLRRQNEADRRRLEIIRSRAQVMFDEPPSPA